MMKRARGRPRIDPTDDTISVHVRVPTRQYDQLFALKSRARLASVPDVIRAYLTRAISGPKITRR